jgi:Protein of unknown function (DUF2587)
MSEQPGVPIIIGPDGTPVALPPNAMGASGSLPAIADAGTGAIPDDDGAESVASMVEQPAKVMRIGTMIKQLLDEVRSAPLDEAGRARMASIYERSIKELESGLAPELVDELERLSLPFTDNEVPSEAELRIAQAQLVGWLEGLFHGIQTALFAQQMSARAQFEEMRRRAAIPQGPGPENDDEPRGMQQSGPYL